ncbi:hypothetical protein C4F51_01670 [Cellvibrio sp. KB43]|uniref:Uncharacterized protein n=1 Tax=Cellvibrio polysaccharolyticus TaxID=2082724 RepID=A0A928V2S9_9GAMM|nr:hypothetical protein [Cellvibrio polysaccharolyticus]
MQPFFTARRIAKASILIFVDLMTENVLSVMSVTEEKQTLNAELSRPYSNKVMFHLFTMTSNNYFGDARITATGNPREHAP